MYSFEPHVLTRIDTHSNTHAHTFTHNSHTFAHARTHTHTNHRFNHNIFSPAYLQLLTRWFQFGLFCPLFRSHGHRLPTLPPVSCGAGDSGGFNEVWHFAEPYRSAIVRTMRMREEMRSYVDELYSEAASFGHPLMRMLQCVDIIHSITIDIETLIMENHIIPCCPPPPIHQPPYVLLPYPHFALS